MSGLCVATLGFCAAGWLALAPFAFGYRGPGMREAALTDRATGAGLALVSLVTLVSWVIAWRRKLRADGILARTSRWQARREAHAQRRRQHDGEGPARAPDPAQVLSELRALLIPLLPESATPANGQAAPAAGQATPANGQVLGGIPEPRDEPGEFGEPERSRPEPDGERSGCAVPVVPAARSEGLAAMDSMLAGSELLMVGAGEEEAW